MPLLALPRSLTLSLSHLLSAPFAFGLWQPSNSTQRHLATLSCWQNCWPLYKIFITNCIDRVDLKEGERERAREGDCGRRRLSRVSIYCATESLKALLSLSHSLALSLIRGLSHLPSLSPQSFGAKSKIPRLSRAWLVRLRIGANNLITIKAAI